MTGGHTAVAINGVVGSFFPNGRGLRQGDHISPLLFNSIVDALSCILNCMAAVGHIRPVISHMLPSGVSHLQYADDTIIMIENDDLGLANLKFLLVCFEAMSGLKINLSKSQVLVLGCTPDDSSRIANILDCQLGSFSFKYLGIRYLPLRFFPMNLPSRFLKLVIGLCPGGVVIILLLARFASRMPIYLLCLCF